MAFLAGGPGLEGREPLAEASARLQPTRGGAQDVEEVGFDAERRYGKGGAGEQPVEAFAALFRGWQAEAGRLRELLRFNAHADRLAEAGLIAFVPVAEVDARGYAPRGRLRGRVVPSLLNARTERPALHAFQSAIHEGAQTASGSATARRWRQP